MTFSSSTIVSFDAARSFNRLSQLYGASASRLSSGLRIQHASDGILEFIRGHNLASSIRIYQGIQSNLTDYQSMLNVASDAASEIRTKLEEMMEDATAASDAGMSAAERSALFAEFDALRSGIDNIANGTQFDDKGILYDAATFNQPISIAITPDQSVSMDFELDPLDLTDGLTIDNTAWADETDAAASAVEIQTALDTVDTFLANVSGFISEIDSHLRITDTIVENSQAARSSLVEVDAAEELVTFTALDVKRQAAAAILSQANLSQRSVLQLFQFNFG